MTQSHESFRRFALLYACYHLAILILLVAGLGGFCWFLAKRDWMPPQYAIPVLAFPLILFVMELWQLYRIHKSDLSARRNPAVSFLPGEHVTDVIPGLHSTGWWVRNSARFLGGDAIGLVNAIVLTDQQVLLVRVPLDGSELLFIDIGPEPKRNRDEVERRLREMLATEGLEEIPSQHAIPYENILAVKFSQPTRRVKLVTKNGVFGYKVWEKRDFLKATELLSRFKRSTAG